MPAFKLTVAYEGTDFVGWQRQASGVSIQGLLEDACADLDDDAVAIVGAGRTDAGVHASGQVAGLTLKRVIDADTLARAINARLPDAVRVLEAAAVGDTFHARFGARSKAYQYRLWNAPVMHPFERRFAWHVPAPPLDVDAMAAAARYFEGHHDFAAMQATGSDVQSSERTVFISQVLRPTQEPLITYDISGDGFLRHMVRNIVGTLVEVGRGRRPVAWVKEVLESKDRALAGPTAPPQGLCLVRVDYE